MSIRILSQWITFTVSVAMVVTALMAWRRYRVCAFGIFVLYGLTDVVFYTIALGLKLSHLGNTLSPFRSVFQDSLILTYLLLIVHDYIKGRGAIWKYG